jgi:formylmethanofuran dehydrogenase subunit B
MPSKVRLLVMEGCETCEEMQRRLRGRADVEIINVDTEPEKTRALARQLEAQGDIGVIDALPQCILQRSDGRFERCDTEHIEQVLDEEGDGND